jgi:hypothetical protein
MSEHGWPPPEDDDTRWRWQPVGLSGDGERVQLREVQLWGRRAEIDADGRVFCWCCWSLVDVETLGTPGNGHAASPFAGTYGVKIQRLPEAEDEPAASQSIDVRKF